MAVYNLPAELPRDASAAFGDQLAPLLPEIASANFRLPLAQSGLSESVQHAVVLHNGHLTTNFGYLAKFL